MNRLAVIGHPVAHSLSPAMHTAAFEALGIGEEWSYDAVDVSPANFGEGLDELWGSGYAGVNVTVPHKEAAFRIADRRSDAVREIGAANTLTFDEKGDGRRQHRRERPDRLAARRVRSGGSPGARARRRRLRARRRLGARPGGRGSRGLQPHGGEGRAARRRPRRRPSARSPPDGENLDLSGVDLLVNSTSVGLAREGAPAPEPGSDLKALRIRADQLVDPMVVVDLVYGAEPTELAATCMSGGAAFVDGLEILVQQGAESFRIWTGLEPPLEIMRSAVREHRA